MIEDENREEELQPREDERPCEEAGGTLSVIKAPRVSIASIPAIGFFAWVCCLVYTCWNIVQPTECTHSIDSALYRSSCFAPLLDPSEHVDIKIYVGLPNDANSLSGELVWELQNHSVNKPVTASFHVPIPAPVRLESQFLNSWVVISPTEDVERNPVLTAEYSLSRRIITSHLLTTLRPLSSQSRERELLSDLSVHVPSDKLSSSSEKQYSGTSSMMGQHWKYGIHPMVIRYTHYGGRSLVSPFLSSLSYQLRSRYVRAIDKPDLGSGSGQNQKQQQRERVPPKSPYQLVYEPIVFFDELSLLRGHLLEMSRDVSRPAPKMHLKFSPTSPLLFGFKRVMVLIIDILGGLFSEAEVEEIKYWMSDDRLFRYFLTQLFTWLHIGLEYLAFRDDWKFFVGRKDFRGISSTSMIFSVARSAVIFLYLWDAETSMLILASIGKDIIWSSWKLYRVIKPRIYLLRGFIPWITYLEDSNLNDQEQHSTRYDHIATLHVSLCVYPCVVGLAIYSLLNYKYKSWWTWVISSLADSVYFFGFISMTPQLYINYKLKSVAHLPVKAFMYKIFSTFIDDVFAFIVKMPLKHRIMTLRDDVVFFGFLYQWWIYRVDKSRVNEFGFAFEDQGDVTENPLLIKKDGEILSQEVEGDEKESNETCK